MFVYALDGRFRTSLLAAYHKGQIFIVDLYEIHGNQIDLGCQAPEKYFVKDSIKDKFFCHEDYVDSFMNGDCSIDRFAFAQTSLSNINPTSTFCFNIFVS